MINRPEAIYGQRYPCPAHQHCDGSFKVGRATDPKGTISCRIQGQSVRRCTYLSVPSAQSPTVAGKIRGNGRTAGQTDKHTDSPCILQDIVPFGSAAPKTAKTGRIK